MKQSSAANHAINRTALQRRSWAQSYGLPPVIANRYTLFPSVIIIPWGWAISMLCRWNIFLGSKYFQAPVLLKRGPMRSHFFPEVIIFNKSLPVQDFFLNSSKREPMSLYQISSDNSQKIIFTRLFFDWFVQRLMIFVSRKVTYLSLN